MHPEEEDKLTTSSRWMTRPSFDRMNLEITSDHYFMLFSCNFLSWNVDTFVSLVSFLSFSHFSQTMVVHRCANFYIHYQISMLTTLSSLFPSFEEQYFCLRSGILTTRTSESVILPSSSLPVKIGKLRDLWRICIWTCHHDLHHSRSFNKIWKTIECYWGFPTWCTSFSQDSYLLCYSAATDVVQNSSIATLWCASWVEVWNGCMGWSLSLSEDLSSLAMRKALRM